MSHTQLRFRTKGTFDITEPLFNLAASLGLEFSRVDDSKFQTGGDFRQVCRLKDRSIIAIVFFWGSVFRNRSLQGFLERRKILPEKVRGLADISRFVVKYRKQTGDAHLAVHLRVRDA
ncbi:hypothetical protein ATW55_09580 [Ferroacidibacillus organovorans]|uniref:Uncharacterized protein n=1 Tax=Ferroacidibacillus organovorans TaxID=1765683 RepID=A0A101XRI5_9BACL|nr:hypothetical protein ATW55_09580 [Ferroacidibacillus organovorans]